MQRRLHVVIEHNYCGARITSPRCSNEGWPTVQEGVEHSMIMIADEMHYICRQSWAWLLQ